MEKYFLKIDLKSNPVPYKRTTQRSKFACKDYVGGKIKCRKRKIKCRIFATNYLSFNLKLKL
ncbi:hypothetical protein K5A28_001646 [Campylobacter coli]|nr:hypothetical protein [Campylobacter coli]